MTKIPIAFTLAIAVAAFACGNSAGPGAEAAPAAEGNTPAAVGAVPAAEGTAQPASVDRGPVAVRVNGVPIYKIDVEQALQNQMESSGLGPDAPEDKKKEAEKTVVDGLIGSELLFQKAQSIPIEIPQADLDQAMGQARQRMGEEGLKAELDKRRMAEKDLVRMIRQNMTIQKMIQETIVGPTQVPEEELKRFYEEHLTEMHEPEHVDASHILIRSAATDEAEKRQAARGRIEGALNRVKAGEDFAAVAREMSEDTASAASGGVLGAMHRGQTVPAFEEAAFKLEAGQVSEVVETDFGYHVIKVSQKHAAGTAPFDRARGRIADFLKHQKSRQAIEQMVTSLRAAAKIEFL